jgi:hypothetical protein
MPVHSVQVVLTSLSNDTQKMLLASHQDKPSMPLAITQGFLKSTAALLQTQLQAGRAVNGSWLDA